jgi:predicted nucleotide-binding protein
LSEFDPKEKALRFAGKQLLALDDIVREAKSGGDTTLSFEQLKRWKGMTVELLAEHVNESEAHAFEKKRLGSFIMGRPLHNFLTEAKMYRAFLLALVEDLNKNPERVLKAKTRTAEVAAISVPAPTASRTVFLIHGHDELNLLRLRELLRDRWNLDSVVLKERPGKGRTLIEKFEEEAPAASFAMALLSPDDVVQGASTTDLYPQARPNVVFELGWFYGRLGRERVCILIRTGTKIHSDLDGISRIEFKESIEEVADAIGRELEAAQLV